MPVGLTPAARPLGKQAHGRRRHVVLVSCSAVLALLLGSAPAAADTAGFTSTPTTHQGFDYQVAGHPPTADKPQSKLWFADGSWWAVMISPADAKQVNVFELMRDHSWRDTGVTIDDRTTSTADVLYEEGVLYTASRTSSSDVRVNRLRFEPATRTWRQDSGFPVSASAGGSESVTLARDSLGRLWITFTRHRTVWVQRTIDSGHRSWTAPSTPGSVDVQVSSDDLSAIVAFNGRIGVMWSNQNVDRFRFAVHMDTAPDGQWTIESPLAGTNIADDHINLKTFSSDAQGRIYAAVKTSLGDLSTDPSSSPLIVVLARSAAGAWSSSTFGTVADDHSRPMLVVDETSQEINVFATAPVKGGSIYRKRAPLSDVRFAPGRGEKFVTYPGAYLNNATSTKDPVNAATGLVVLAAQHGTTHRYYHTEVALSGGTGGADTTPPSSPASVSATALDSTSAQVRWAASSDGTGVTGYTVHRDGAAVGTTTGTSLTDSPLAPETTYSYTVVANDAAGNRSTASAPAQVTTPPAQIQAPPPSTGIAFRAASSAQNGGATSVTVPAPSGVVAGDVLLATIDVRGRPVVTAPAGWQLVRRDDGSTTMQKATFWKAVATNEPTSYTFALSSTMGATALVAAYSGVSTTSPVDAHSGLVTEKSNAVTAPGVTTTVPDAYLIGLFGVATATSITPPSGMTERSEAVTPSSTYKVTGEWADGRQATAGTTGPRVATAALSAKNIGQLIALRPAG